MNFPQPSLRRLVWQTSKDEDLHQSGERRTLMMEPRPVSSTNILQARLYEKKNRRTLPNQCTAYLESMPFLNSGMKDEQDSVELRLLMLELLSVRRSTPSFYYIGGGHICMLVTDRMYHHTNHSHGMGVAQVGIVPAILIQVDQIVSRPLPKNGENNPRRLFLADGTSESKNFCGTIAISYRKCHQRRQHR